MRTLLVLLAGCSVTAPPADPSTSALIFGTDDRTEAFAATDPSLLAALDATVVMVDRDDLRSLGSGVRVEDSGTLGSRYGVCSAEPFSTQPVAGICSGVLVGDDLIATAGHCISDTTCSDRSFVFGYRMEDATTVRDVVDDDDVYDCVEILGRANTLADDWALVRVDRAVVGHTPAVVRAAGILPDDATLTMIGHPAGLPVKIVSDVAVDDNHAPLWFSAPLDAFGGNSGSPAFNAATWEVEGIVVRNPAEDWVGSGSCVVSLQCPDAGCALGTTQVSRVTELSPLLPGNTCVDDAAEPDDRPSLARLVSPGAVRGTACPGDPDWVSLPVFAGQRVTLSAVGMTLEAEQDGTSLGSGTDTLTVVPPDDGRLDVSVSGDGPYRLDLAPELVVRGPTAITGGAFLTLDTSGAEPAQRVFVLAGGPAGSRPMPGCPGETVDLGGSVVLGSAVADDAGVARVTRQAPDGVTGDFGVQAVVLDTCTKSAVAPLSLSPAPPQ
jgi:hypothetical protein